MNHRERIKAILHYEDYDALPIVHFGFWPETLDKWVSEGYISYTPEEIKAATVNGSDAEAVLAEQLGFDFNWYSVLWDKAGWISLYPKFEKKVVKELEDGSYHMQNEEGMIVLQREGATGIPSEIGYTLKDRRSWEESYLPRLQANADRVNSERIAYFEAMESIRERPVGLYLGSLFGQIRNWMGIVGVSYLYADDEDLYDEIINTVGDLCYKCTKRLLDSGIEFDFAHFWEDICFKNGPLVSPAVFAEKVGPHYKRITDLVNSHGIDVVSLDCDGVIDALVPIWLENGVNTMFPIEVGVWDAEITPWREKYGRVLRGVGGMRKHALSQDRAAVDREIERMKPLVELGGFIPCPDHRLPINVKWELVQYYTDKIKENF